MNERIKLYGVKWSVDTAGPSPDSNKRSEIFFYGCQRAMDNNPCKGCFNNKLWDSSDATIDYSPEEILEKIKEYAPNKYITIGGGEPLDQPKGLIELCKLLKAEGFHIMLYSWRLLGEIGNNPNMKDVLNYIDILVDGPYLQSVRIWDDRKKDGFLSSIGSNNQTVWDIKNKRGVRVENLKAIELGKNNQVVFTEID